MTRFITTFSLLSALTLFGFTTEASAQRQLRQLTFIPQTTHVENMNHSTAMRGHGQPAARRNVDRYSTIFDPGARTRTSRGVNVHQDYLNGRWVNNARTPGYPYTPPNNWNNNNRKFQMSPQQAQQLQQGVQNFANAWQQVRQQRQTRRGW